MATRIEFGTGCGRSTSVGRFAEIARVADDCGFSSITHIDSQILSRDVYVSLTHAADRTKRIRLGQGVTNPYTRHPSVTANATASLDEVSGGRAFLGIGAGYSSVEAMGLKPRPLRDFRRYVEFLKTYLSGGTAEWNGKTMKSNWITRPIPLMVATGGPRSMVMAGELGDEIVIQGAHPLIIKWRLELIERGAKKAGRNMADIPVWVRSMCYPAASKAEARRWVQDYAVNGATGTDFQVLQWKNDPDVQDLVARLEKAQPGIVEEMQRVARSFKIETLEKHGNPSGQLVTQRIIDMFEFSGTPAEIEAQIRALMEIGIRHFFFTVYVLEEHDPEGNLRTIAKEIFPRFR